MAFPAALSWRTLLGLAQRLREHAVQIAITLGVFIVFMAVGSGNASFALSEVKIGLVPATISPYVIATIGERSARRYFMTAERFNAQIAQQIGLLSEVVDIENLDDQLSQLVDLLLANGPEAVKAAKKLVSHVSEKAITKALIDHTCEVIASIRVSQQGQEGLNAFLDKRKPNWLKD